MTEIALYQEGKTLAREVDNVKDAVLELTTFLIFDMLINRYATRYPRYPYYTDPFGLGYKDALWKRVVNEE